MTNHRPTITRGPKEHKESHSPEHVTERLRKAPHAEHPHRIPHSGRSHKRRHVHTAADQE
jgi:hypothetical protein